VARILSGASFAIRGRVVRAHRADCDRKLAAPESAGAGDLQYAIDRVSEDGLVELVEAAFEGALPVRLISEGLPEEGVLVGRGAVAQLLVVDPIDGTRGLMHDKRSAFVLAGLAPDTRGVTLQDVTDAAMVEIPTTRSQLSDVFAATRGAGVTGFTESLDDGSRRVLAVAPSQATTLAHGFATFARFFPGAQEAIGRLADDFFARIGSPEEDAPVFEDQYISNGGQCHALLTGRDRFVADLRPLFRDRAGRELLCAHPYDLLGGVILEEAGIPVTDEKGRALAPPLDLTSRVAFAAYANETLRRVLEPELLAAIRIHAGPAR
jgi:fructose-1,6-bisphosphatase/inositol monophosphatase family enzyme